MQQIRTDLQQALTSIQAESECTVKVASAWEGFRQGATGPENRSGPPRRKVQPGRGAGGDFQISPGVQYLRLFLHANLLGNPRHGLRPCWGL